VNDEAADRLAQGDPRPWLLPAAQAAAPGCTAVAAVRRLTGGANQETWAFDALTPDYKAILQSASATVHAELIGRYDSRNPAALRQLAGAGAQIKPFPRPVLDAAFKASMDLCHALERSNPKSPARCCWRLWG